MSSLRMAANTRLPPSPELGGNPFNPLISSNMDPLSLTESTNISNQQPQKASRLRSITRYDSFHPLALACSPVPVSYADTDNNTSALSKSRNKQLGRPITAQHHQRKKNISPERGTTSLGAIAGYQGVVLFRMSKPSAPLLVFKHATDNQTRKHGVTSLCFQPDGSDGSSNSGSGGSRSLHLAAARGCGVLVWDVSGHSLSPLTKRLGFGFGSSASSEKDSVITSLAWQPRSDETPWLAATTASAAGIWDLRESSTSPFHKPSLRFGSGASSLFKSNSTENIVAPNVQIACSKNLQCGILNAAGALQIHDVRMADRPAPLSSFSSFDHAGIGLTCLASSKEKTCWVTWGLDTRNADAVVKVWTSIDSPKINVHEDYWRMDGSPKRERAAFDDSSTKCQLLGKCTTPNLACARVCPDPVENSIVTVGLDLDENSWRADLWKIRIAEKEEQRIIKVTSFQGGSDAESKLTSMFGGDSRLGPLRASELAISSVPGAIVQPDGSKQIAPFDEDHDAELGLLLCSLTENGYITTHAIPEALPGDSMQSGGRSLTPSSDAARTSLSGQPRVFTDEREVAFNDAAKVWIKNAESPIVVGETRAIKEKQEMPPIQASQEMAPFELDVPGPYSLATGNITSVQIAGVNDMVPTSAGPAGIGAIEDPGPPTTGTDARAAAALMQSIETNRIPCPRLCGATFGPGVGGLAVYQNGAVRRMWNWYQRTDSNDLLRTIPGLKVGEPSLASNSPQDLAETCMIEPEISREFPRTLQDLDNMASAAKEAQWGGQDDSDVSSTGYRHADDSFFDVDSDGSSDSAEEDGEEVAYTTDAKNTFDFRKPVAELLSGKNDVSNNNENRDHDQKIAAEAVMPSSDLLAPLVKVSHEYDRMALNKQCIEFAELWSLGPLDSQLVENEDQTYSSVRDKREKAQNIFEGFSNNVYPPLETPAKAATSRPLPHVRSVPIIRDPNSVFVTDDETGVHGGQNSTRPGMQESMVFLRKLFTRQQEFGQTTFLPPDNPRGVSIAPKRLASTEGFPNVSTVNGLPFNGGEGREFQALKEIKQICISNASTSASFGDTEKGEVWELLAQIISSRLADLGNPFDGWGGTSGGGALGENLVGNVLRYYESLGDVQMLSTMVCVLRRGRRLSRCKDKREFSFLPPGQDEKYDNFIRRYSDLLYGWGLLNIRTELMKHLVRVLPHTESRPLCKLVESEDGPPKGRSPGIAPVFSCPRCGNETELGTNYCLSCQDYAFRCSICDESVRGLFTVCDRCGHGGHVGHLMKWFASYSECPTGCGCRCTFAFMSDANNVQPNVVEDQTGFLPPAQSQLE